MPIEIKKYEKPPAGIHNAVCCEISEVMVEGKNFKTQQPEKQMKLIFSFELEAEDSFGRRFILTRGAEFFLNSGLNANNPLGQFLTKWGGGSVPTSDENLEKMRDALNARKYVTANAALVVVHKTSGTGREYAKIDSISPSILPADRRMVPSEKYTPWEKRQNQMNDNQPASAPVAQTPTDKSPVPF